MKFKIVQNLFTDHRFLPEARYIYKFSFIPYVYRLIYSIPLSYVHYFHHQYTALVIRRVTSHLSFGSSVHLSRFKVFVSLSDHHSCLAGRVHQSHWHQILLVYYIIQNKLLLSAEIFTSINSSLDSTNHNLLLECFSSSTLISSFEHKVLYLTGQ